MDANRIVCGGVVVRGSAKDLLPNLLLMDLVCRVVQNPPTDVDKHLPKPRGFGEIGAGNHLIYQQASTICYVAAVCLCHSDRILSEYNCERQADCLSAIYVKSLTI